MTSEAKIADRIMSNLQIRHFQTSGLDMEADVRINGHEVTVHWERLFFTSEHVTCKSVYVPLRELFNDSKVLQDRLREYIVDTFYAEGTSPMAESGKKAHALHLSNLFDKALVYLKVDCKHCHGTGHEDHETPCQDCCGTGDGDHGPFSLSMLEGDIDRRREEWADRDREEQV